VSARDGTQIHIPVGRSVTIGRADSADRIVDGHTVSRTHARIELSRGGLAITDLESRNGTYVNGSRIRSAVLAAGDVVMFGQIAFTIEVNDELL
jgi:pSer/pThr/pTyr-binding forkhead associated (FHA) protein